MVSFLLHRHWDPLRENWALKELIKKSEVKPKFDFSDHAKAISTLRLIFLPFASSFSLYELVLSV